MDLHEANVSAHQLWRNAVVERGVVSLDECDGLSHTCVPNGTCVDGHEAGERFGGNGTSEKHTMSPIPATPDLFTVTVVRLGERRWSTSSL